MEFPEIGPMSRISAVHAMTHEGRRVVMRKRAGVCGGLALCVPLALFGAEAPEGPFVTEKMIEEQGGVHFSLPKLGTFTIEAVEYSAELAGECHVSLQSVANSVENGIATGDFELVAGAKKTVKLKKYVFDDGTIVCNGEGSDCKVKVGVDSVVSM
jgi:hypothetical protein